MLEVPGSAPLRESVPLAPYTTLGVGGPARFMIEATVEDHIHDALEFASAGGWPVFILGGGSNILVSDRGFPGLVLRVALRGIDLSRMESGVVTAAAGEEWDPFVHSCLAADLEGIECLSGIPGTVGGTPVQNVGAYGQDASGVIRSVRVFDRSTRRVTELGNADCGFSYRSSIFNTGRDRFIILSVTYCLRPGGEPEIGHPDLKHHFAQAGIRPSLAAARDTVLKIRASKGMILWPGDPDSRSAGSFFKNPIVTAEALSRVEEAARRGGQLAAGESLPRFQAPTGMWKLPAAWLIERAGFPRGYTRGRAGISSRHTLALVNRGGAAAREIVELMNEIQSGVEKAFGIALAPEPVFVGF